MGKTEDLFSPKPRIHRSPMKKLNENQLINTNPTDDNEHLKRKRKINETNDDTRINEFEEEPDEVSNKHLSDQLKNLFDLIAITSRTHSDEISTVKNELAQKIETISEKVNQIESDVGSLHSKVHNIDNKVNEVSKIAQMNKKLINNMLQDNLSKCMDIDGVEKNVIDKATDLKVLALEIIRSFKIKINAEDIDRVSKKEIRKDEDGSSKMKCMLMVFFKEFETKIRILRSKRSIDDNREIYFNATLTPTNRYYMMQARKKAKKAGLKVFFSSGRVNVQKSNKEILTIETENDLISLDKYVNENQQQAQTTSM